MWPKAFFDQISKCRFLKFVKVQVESFHLNGHIIGFRLQTPKLESPYKTPSSTLAVKGLTEVWQLYNGLFMQICH